MASPATAANISKADTPPQEYSDGDSENTIPDVEEGDNASGGAAADAE